MAYGLTVEWHGTIEVVELIDLDTGKVSYVIKELIQDG